MHTKGLRLIHQGRPRLPCVHIISGIDQTKEICNPKVNRNLPLKGAVRLQEQVWLLGGTARGRNSRIKSKEPKCEDYKPHPED